MPPAFPSATKRPRMSCGLLILLIILAFAGTLILWHIIWRVGNARAVARLEKTARDRSEPITLTELAKTYPEVADEENIYIALEEVWAKEDLEFWTAFRTGERALPEKKEPAKGDNLPYFGLRMSHTNALDSDSMQALQSFLASNKTHMAQVRLALARKAFRAPIQFEEGYSALLPYLSQVKSEARLFQMEALRASELRQTGQALDAIASISRVGHCLDDDPLLIGQLVRIACYTMTISSMERLLPHQQLNDREFARLEEILAGLKAAPGLKKALLGERAVGFDTFNASPQAMQALSSPAPGDAPDSSPRDVAFGFRLYALVGMKNADKKLMGETYEKTLQCIENPDYATNNRLHEIFEMMAVKARAFPPKMMTAMLMPALEKAGEKFARLEALRRCAETAIAIERYRLQHSEKIPNQLSDLPGALRLDPFTGEPLRFKKTAKGYVVYSLGPDRKDNDGLMERPKNGPSNQELDVGFRVER